MADGIAIIGLAGRLPGAADLDAYWENLLSARDCIARQSVDELHGLVPDALLRDERWVGASGRIDGAYDFDPESFGMSPRAAMVTDPQHRLLLTAVHDALEDAAVVPGLEQRVGVFASVSRNRHEDLVRAVLLSRGEVVDELELEIGNEKDHAATKVAYRFGLNGPAVTIQSACSSGLVAVHQACRALASYECDVAVVAAAAVRVPDAYGYLHLPGTIGSADGMCRPFSARASGAVAGDGVVAVVLKRADDADSDGDCIRAVILGSAVNNDGAKAGYASVSAAAQEAVIRDALLFAEADAATVGSVEAHGSGTPLGDATEWAALAAVYGCDTTTLVGSVKSSVGHLSEASGLAGMARVVASLEHARIPPTINVGLPAPFTRDHGTGLALARRVQPWPLAGVRRAAVSSFGLGGTNAHVVLEQAPPRRTDRLDTPGIRSLVLVSGRTSAAVDATGRRWVTALSAGASPAAAADVSQRRRRHGGERRFAVGTDAHDLRGDLLRDPGPAVGAGRGLCFVFPGVGDHYAAMGAGLRAILPGFGTELDRLVAACSEQAGRDLSAALSTAPAAPGDTLGVSLRRLVERRDVQAIEDTDTIATHATLFSLQVALALSLQRLGLTPDAVVGHSLGELSAATVAGALDEQEAIRLVVARATLIDQCPPGAMLALTASAESARTYLSPGVWLAAVNSPRSSVVAGERDKVVALADELAARDEAARLLPTARALHTPLMEPAARGLAELLRRTQIRAPRVAFAANVTGDWAAEELTRPEYWQRHLTSTVLFGPALATSASRAGVLLEIGPGQLRTLATQARRELADVSVVPTIRREYQNEPDDAVLLRALGELWRVGHAADWPVLAGGRRPRIAPLPATALEERELRIDAGAQVILDHAGVSGPAPMLRKDPRRPAGVTADVREPVPADGSPVLRALRESWAHVLGVAEPGLDDDFFDLGGDSMMIVRLIRELEGRLGRHVPAMVLFEESRLGRMTAGIEAWCDKEAAVDGVTELAARLDTVITSTEDFTGDVELDPAIASPASGAAITGPEEPAAVLLTGANGFFGSFILRELLDRTAATVFCLVRAGDTEQALGRLRQSLTEYRLWTEELRDRIVPVAGDLGQPMLGLTADRFGQLADQIDVIYHNGARVNQAEPYSRMRNENVLGVQEIFRLASRNRVIPVHYVSTAGVIVAGAGDPEVLPAQWVSDPGLLGASGYLRSKWVAEGITRIAGSRGIPVAIYRPTRISGHSLTGACGRNDGLWHYVRACLELGACPIRGEAANRANLVPVDFAARALLHLSLARPADGTVYNVAAPVSVNMDTVFGHAREIGYPIDFVPADEWAQRLNKAAETTPVSDATSLHVIALLGDDRGSPNARSSGQLDLRSLTQGLEGTMIECPAITTELLDKYFAYFTESGFFPRADAK